MEHGVVTLRPEIAVPHPFGSSAARRFAARAKAMTVAAGVLGTLLVLGPAFVLVAQRTARYEPPKLSVTRALVLDVAYDAFPRWATTNHVEACPASIDALVPYLGRAAVDAWGTPLELRCGPGYRGAFVRSAGEDGAFDTADDVTSND